LGILDIVAISRFFGSMTVLIPQEALRVARALLDLSQSEVAEGAKLAKKTVQRSEAGPLSTARASGRLQEFYEKQGVAFLGLVDLATGKVSGAGARWRMPHSLPPSESERDTFKTETFGVHFKAARALLNESQQAVADRANLSTKVIAALELGQGYNDIDFKCLRDFYAGQTIEFLSWGDTSRGVYYGVGVCRSCG
jgi:DNA-binding XRE family transcriptional regulator